MDKKTPNKRKSLANTNTTPTKIQKTVVSPAFQKKNKSPKSANKNQKTPQKKQFNGNQNTPKEKKKPIKTEDDEDDSEENETDDSIEDAGNSILTAKAEDDSSDEEESGDEEEEEEKPVKKQGKNTDKSSDDRKFSVYIAGLDYKFSEDDIRKHFPGTNILSVVLLRNPVTKKSKGSGFINFKDEASVKKALLKNETELDGRTIKVNIPVKKDKSANAELKKKLLLKKLKLQVAQLEKDLAGTGKKKNKFEKQTTPNKTNKKSNFNKKSIAKPIKQE